MLVDNVALCIYLLFLLNLRLHIEYLIVSFLSDLKVLRIASIGSLSRTLLALALQVAFNDLFLLVNFLSKSLLFFEEALNHG